MQIDKTEFNAAVAEAKQRGILTERLATLGMQIARGYLSSEKFSHYSAADREDVLGAWTVLFVRKWEKMDPKKNCFSWITSTVRSAHFIWARSAARRAKRESKKAEDDYHYHMQQTKRYIRSYEAEIPKKNGAV